MSSSDTRIAVYFLDVGQGDCSFIIPPGKPSAVLMDCADAYVAERFVEDHGIRNLPVVVASHLDRDHVGGMLSFLASFLAKGGSVGKVYAGIDRTLAGSHEFPGSVAEELLRHLVQWAKEKRFNLGAPTRDDDQPKTLYEGKGWHIELILPHYSDLLDMRLTDSEEPNACSAVLRVVCGGQAVLIGADAPLCSWERLEPDLISARVFRTPHHGGNLDDGTARSWNLADLYRHVGAEICVYSVGTRNPYRHPLPGHVNASQRAGASRILCTQLTARCHGDPLMHRELAVENVSGIVYPYRHRIEADDRNGYRPKHEVPCAGSTIVVLDLQGKMQVEPTVRGWHDDFVSLMDVPLCRQT